MIRWLKAIAVQLLTLFSCPRNTVPSRCDSRLGLTRPRHGRAWIVQYILHNTVSFCPGTSASNPIAWQSRGVKIRGRCARQLACPLPQVFSVHMHPIQCMQLEAEREEDICQINARSLCSSAHSAKMEESQLGAASAPAETTASSCWPIFKPRAHCQVAALSTTTEFWCQVKVCTKSRTFT